MGEQGSKWQRGSAEVPAHLGWNSSLLSRGPGPNCPPACTLPSLGTSALANAMNHLWGSPLPAPPKVTSMSPRSTGLICWGLVELSSAANPLGGSCQIIN